MVWKPSGQVRGYLPLARMRCSFSSSHLAVSLLRGLQVRVSHKAQRRIVSLSMNTTTGRERAGRRKRCHPSTVRFGDHLKRYENFTGQDCDHLPSCKHTAGLPT